MDRRIGTAGFTAEEILDSVGQAVVVTDLTGRITSWNRAAAALYGWTAEEAIGRQIVDMVVSPSEQGTAEEIRQTLLSGGTWTGGFPMRRKDGSDFPALVTATGIHREGELVGLVSVSTNLGSAIEPLLERSTDAAIVLRQDGTVAYASPAVGPLFGWEDSIVGTSLVPLVHPDEREDLVAFIETVAGRPGPHPAVELRVLSEEGWLWCEAALTNLLDDPGVRGLICNLRLSLRKEAHETAAQQVQQLDAALRSRVVIEQAKGFLAARHAMSPDDAFAALRRHARSNRLLIRDVARAVVEGTLDLPV